MNGQVVTWFSVPGKNYQVFATTNAAAEFQLLSSTVTAFNATTSYTNVAPSTVQQFYRVKVLSY